MSETSARARRLAFRFGSLVRNGLIERRPLPSSAPRAPAGGAPEPEADSEDRAPWLASAVAVPAVAPAGCPDAPGGRAGAGAGAGAGIGGTMRGAGGDEAAPPAVV